MSEVLGTVVFIDDEEDSRFIYGAVLEEIYGTNFSVEALEPSESIDVMLKMIGMIDNVVSIIIDEKLQVGARTGYKGSELVQAIRGYDTKLPLYILTSEMGLIEPPFGSVEYIIDKGKIAEPDYKRECSMLMLRHIDSFNDIRSSRMERFDALLKKSLTEELTAEEVLEYNELDLWRMRKVIAVESLVLNYELDEHARLLKEIEEDIKKVLERD